MRGGRFGLVARLGRLAILVSLLGGATACGIGAQQHASVIPSRDVPSGLLQTTGSPSPSPSSQSPTSIIYLVQTQPDNQDRLVPVRRPATQTATLLGLLTSLLKGPTDQELNDGLTSALNAAPALNSVKSSDGIATIDLGSTFAAIRGQSQVLATAQLVLTAASYPGVDSVLITIDLLPAAVPLADGTLTNQPLRASDYSCLVAGSADACTAGAVDLVPPASVSSSSAPSTPPSASPSAAASGPPSATPS